jgi:hypothetical protein
MRRQSILILALLGIASHLDAHPGGLDAQGGHHNRKTGDYHFHRGGAAADAPVQPAPIVREPRTAPPTPRLAARLTAPSSTAWAESEPREQAKPRVTTAADKVKEAELQLAMARRLLVEVSTDFEGTPSAVTARQLLREHFPEHVEHVEVKAAETQSKKASSRLFLARKLLDSGKEAEAKRWLGDIVREFPDSEQAKEAASLLRLIP